MLYSDVIPADKCFYEAGISVDNAGLCLQSQFQNSTFGIAKYSKMQGSFTCIELHGNYEQTQDGSEQPFLKKLKIIGGNSVNFHLEPKVITKIAVSCKNHQIYIA